LFGVAPKAANGLIELRFKRLLMDVDVTRVCDPDGPVPPGWILREGSDGDDVLIGSSANDLIRGRFGRDRIDGRGGDDILCGDAGADVLRGGDGNDVLIGGGGRDKLNGGLGADRGIDADPHTVRIRVEATR
jgi:Ca2+-binding RTX toxin-like protein